MAVDLRKRTGTGHIIGVTYASHYWHSTYRVLGKSKFYLRGVRVIDAGGKIRDHLTPLSYGHDHPVTEKCPQHICRLKIGS